MPIQDRYVHTLAIVTPTEAASGETDDYGHPLAGEPDVEEVVGLIQPRSARELALISQAGAQLSDHVVFMARRDLTGAAYIRYEPDDGDRFEIVGIRDYNFGTVSDHLEVDCRRVRSAELVTS